MSDTLTIAGSVTTKPTGASPLGQTALAVPINENVAINKKASIEMVLDADAEESVPLGGLTEIHSLTMKVTGGGISVSVTSVAGTDQVFPVNALLILTSTATPLTAIKVQRTPSTQSRVSITLGQRT